MLYLTVFMRSVVIFAFCALLVSGENEKTKSVAKASSKMSNDLVAEEARPPYSSYPAPVPTVPKNEHGLIDEYPTSGHGKLDDTSPNGGYRKGVEPSSGYVGFDNRGPQLPSSYKKSAKDSSPYSSHSYGDPYSDSYSSKPASGYGDSSGYGPSSHSSALSKYSSDYPNPPSTANHHNLNSGHSYGSYAKPPVSSSYSGTYGSGYSPHSSHGSYSPPTSSHSGYAPPSPSYSGSGYVSPSSHGSYSPHTGNSYAPISLGSGYLSNTPSNSASRGNNGHARGRYLSNPSATGSHRYPETHLRNYGSYPKPPMAPSSYPGAYSNGHVPTASHVGYVPPPSGSGYISTMPRNYAAPRGYGGHVPGVSYSGPGRPSGSIPPAPARYPAGIPYSGAGSGSSGYIPKAPLRYPSAPGGSPGASYGPRTQSGYSVDTSGYSNPYGANTYSRRSKVEAPSAYGTVTEKEYSKTVETYGSSQDNNPKGNLLARRALLEGHGLYGGVSYGKSYGIDRNDKSGPFSESQSIYGGYGHLY